MCECVCVCLCVCVLVCVCACVCVCLCVNGEQLLIDQETKKKNQTVGPAFYVGFFFLKDFSYHVVFRCLFLFPRHMTLNDVCVYISLNYYVRVCVRVRVRVRVWVRVGVRLRMRVHVRVHVRVRVCKHRPFEQYM